MLPASIRWGILGTGASANRFAHGLTAARGASLTAVGSRTETAARAFATALRVPRAHATYESLVRDPEVDVVYVATPNSAHRTCCRLALEAGKAVLCEKPFALDAEEVRDIAALARAKRLFCMEAMWTRFVPAMTRLREVIAAGAIGEIRLMTADLGFRAEVGPDHRLFNAALGGGVLLDLGVYLVSLAVQLFGGPDHVAAYAALGASGVDEQCGLVLGYDDGPLATLTASLRAQTPGEATIIGTRGSIRVHAPVYRPHRLTVAPALAWSADAGVRMTPPGERRWKSLLRRYYQRLDRFLAPLVRDGARDIVAPIEGNGYNYEAEEVMRCLRAGLPESATMPLDESVTIAETLDALRLQWSPTTRSPQPVT